jgi:hypothetical protein
MQKCKMVEVRCQKLEARSQKSGYCKLQTGNCKLAAAWPRPSLCLCDFVVKLGSGYRASLAAKRGINLRPRPRQGRLESHNLKPELALELLFLKNPSGVV